MPSPSLPGTLPSRLKYGFLLSGALIRRGVAVAGLRYLDYAFKDPAHPGMHQNPKRLHPVHRAVAFVGYWMLGGVTTGNWNAPPGETSRPSSELP